MNRELTKSIASEFQIFKTLDQKENFLFLLGALMAKVISLQKAAEIMEMEPEMFLQILELLGIEFSYLSENQVYRQKNKDSLTSFIGTAKGSFATAKEADEFISKERDAWSS